MDEIRKYDLLKLDGGINLGEKPTHVEDNQLTYNRNFYTYESRLIRRPGLTRITSTPHTENITGIFPYRKSTGVWVVLVAGLTSVGKLDGTEIVPIPNVDGSSVLSRTYPWCIRQYKDTAYLVRRDLGTLHRTDGVQWGVAGIPPPATACSGVQGAAGDIKAGDYRYVVSFVNSLTEAESDFGPESAKVTIAADKTINLTGIPTSTQYQVNARRIYRTMADQTGQYFLATQINDNFTTSYTDNIPDDILDVAANIDNGLPPGSLRFLEVWRERLWATDGTHLYLSRALYPESWSADLNLSVFPDDGHEIRGMLAFGNMMLVGKTNATHYVCGAGEDDFSLDTLSNIHGVASGHSMKAVRTLAFWYGGDDFYYSDGTSVKGIGSPYLKGILENIPDSYKDRIVSWVHPPNRWYVTSVPQDSSGQNQLDLVLNYEKLREEGKPRWDIFEHGTLKSPAYCDELADENYGRFMYASFYDGHLYRYNYGSDDAGQAISAKFRTKSFGYDMHNLLKAMRRVHVLSPSVPQNLTVKLYRDEETSPVKTRVISLNQQRKWKRLAISNMRRLGATLSLELEYSGASEFEINALAFELVQKLRSSRVI